MKLVEIISDNSTDKSAVSFMDNFLQEKLGKGVVHVQRIHLILLLIV